MASDDRRGSARRGGGFRITPVDAPSFLKFFRVDDASAERPGDGPRDDVWEVASRGDSVAVLLYVESVKSVVLQQRFRAGPAVRGDAPDVGDPRMIETLAAAYDVRADGRPIDCARRCLLERAGYDLTEDMVRQVSTFFASPGASSERIHFFFAVAAAPAEPRDDADEADAEPRGVYDDNEVLMMKARNFLASLDAARDRRDSVDMKLLIGAQELRRWLSYSDPSAL